MVPEKVYQLSEVEKPELIFAKEPQVPAEFVLQKKEIVSLNVKLNKRGDVIDAKILASSEKRLNAAALKAIFHWKYKPAQFAGKPVAVFMDMNVEFFPRKFEQTIEQTQSD